MARCIKTFRVERVSRYRRVAGAALAFFLASIVAVTPAFAAIAFRGASSASIADGDISVVSGGLTGRTNCGSITPGIPAGAVGDLLIAQVIARENAATVAMPGWTVFYTDNVAGQEYQVFLFWRTATNTDPNTITQSGSCNLLGARITRFGNVDPVQPFDFDAGSAVYSDAGDVDTGTQVVNVPNSLLMLATFVADNRRVAEDATFTQLYDDTSPAGRDAGMSLNYRLDGTTGTKGPFTGMDLQGGGKDPNHGLLFVVRPRPLTINVPAGTAANDVMIASITVRACSATSGAACTVTPAAPAGWTLVDTVDQTTGAGTDGFGNRLFVYSRVATAAEPASYTWTFGGTPVHAGAAGGILSFAGVDVTSPVVVSAGQATPASYNHTAPSIDTGAVAETMLVSTHTVNSSGTWTPPPGMTEQVDIASLTPPNSLGLALQMNYEPWAPAGATGTRTSVLSNPPANDTGATHMLALRPSIDHYAISYPNGATAVTCEALNVRVTAHDLGHNAAAVPAGVVMTFTTTTGTGVWLSPAVSGTGTWSPSGANDGQASYTWPGGESVVEVRLRHNTPLASIGINLGGAYTEAAAEDPAAAFVDAAFRVTDSAGTASVAVGTQIAGKDSNTGAGAQTLFLQAIRTDSNTGSCTGVFDTQTVTVELASECNDPGTCVPAPGSQVSVRDSAAAMVPIAPNNSGAVGSYTGVALAFDAQSKAPLVLNYPDAGQITLHARYALPSPPASTFMIGSSNAFVVRPFGIAFRGADAATPVQHGVNETSGLLVPAGDNFTMTVAAYRWASGEDANDDGVPDAGVDITNNGLTPNFRWDTAIAVSANLPGIALGGITLEHADATRDSTVRQAEWANGAATFSTWRYTEAGNALFAATASNYIGAGIGVSGDSGRDGTGAAGGHVGRFRPKHFRLDAGSPPTLSNRAPVLPCISSFTYMGEPMRMSLRLLAQNTQNATTQNYAGAYAKLDPAVPGTAFAFGARSGTADLSARITSVYPGAAPAWSNGVLDITIADPLHVAIERAASGPDGRYTGLQFGIAPSDSDGVPMAAYDLDVNNDASNDHTAVAGTTEVRFGRLFVQNAFGSELLDLAMPLRAQYYVDANTGFVTNTQDSCTSIATLTLWNNLLPSVTGGSGVTKTVNGSTATTGTFGVLASGDAGLSFSAPGSGGDGYVDVSTRDPATGLSPLPAYLKFDWDGDGVHDNDPQGRATFGIHKGSPRHIYRRERY